MFGFSVVGYARLQVGSTSHHRWSAHILARYVLLHQSNVEEPLCCRTGELYIYSRYTSIRVSARKHLHRPRLLNTKLIPSRPHSDINLTFTCQPSTTEMTMAGPKLKTSIAIVGCGDVGATLAYTLILQPICSEVILVDPKKELLEAQVRDLGDATYRGGSGVKVRAGDHKGAGQADIVVITAGAKQKTGITSPKKV